MKKLLVTPIFLFVAITHSHSYAAQLVLNKIDSVPYVAGMMVNLLSINLIAGTTNAGNANVQLDLLDTAGNVLRSAFGGFIFSG